MPELEDQVRMIAQEILGVVQDTENFLFSDLSIENEVEKVLDVIIVESLLMLVQARLEIKELSECLSEIE